MIILKILSNHFSVKKYIDYKLILFIVYNAAYILYMLDYIDRKVYFLSLLLYMLICFFDLLHRSGLVLKKNKLVFLNASKRMLSTVCIFIIISIIIQALNFKFQFSYISSYIYLISPIIIAFLWANTVSADKMMPYFYVLLFRFIIFFILKNLSEISVNAISMITFYNTDSSLYESSDAHMFFALMVVFFSQGKKLFGFISGIFCMLCFKRLSFILTPFFIFFYKYIPKSNVRKSLITVLEVLFIVSPIIVILFVDNVSLIDSMLGIDLNNLTSNRIELIDYVRREIDCFNGYGSINYFMNIKPWGKYIQIKSMHCDVLQIYWETTILGVAAFFHNFLKIGKRNYYILILVVYFALEMVISHFIDLFAAWLVLYMYCGMQEKESQSFC